MIYDTWYRHLLKTGSWRIIAFVVLALTSYWVTGSLALAGSIAVADWVIKTILYFAHEVAWSKTDIGRKTTEQKGCVVWFTGLSGSGKTTIADAVAEELRSEGLPVVRLDGDVARRTFSSDLGFSAEDRAENCRRAAIVSSYLKENHIVLASFISPKKEMRDYVRSLCGEDDTLIIHVDASIEECARRDPKGMYAQLEDGKFKGNPFTGVHPDAPYERPKVKYVEIKTDKGLSHPDTKIISEKEFGEADETLCTRYSDVNMCVQLVIHQLVRKGYNI
jgi:adenylyl-sulfate kinase